MARTVDFYFDYLSPYAYLAWCCLPEVTEPRGVKIVPKPVLFAGLLNHWGQLGPAEVPPKGIHVARDTGRFAALRNVPLRSPRYHPFNPLLALRISLAEVSGADQAEAITALFKAGWVDDKDPGDQEDICNALNNAGLDGERLIASAREPLAKRSLRSETERAVDRGVFGVPTMLVEDELFWGLDQLPYLELFLDGKDPLAGVEKKGLGVLGRAVVRPGSIGRGQGNDGQV